MTEVWKCPLCFRVAHPPAVDELIICPDCGNHGVLEWHLMLKPRRWFVTPELLTWKQAVAAREYSGNFFEWPHRGAEWPPAPIIIDVPVGQYAEEYWDKDLVARFVLLANKRERTPEEEGALADLRELFFRNITAAPERLPACRLSSRTVDPEGFRRALDIWNAL